MNGTSSSEVIVKWSTLGIIGSIVCVVVVSMWTITGSLNNLIDKLDATDQKFNSRLIILENSQITQERLIRWETAFTSIKKDVIQLFNSFENKCDIR